LEHKNLFKSIRQYNYTMNKWLEILVGLVLIALAIYAWGMDLYGFGESALMFLKGGIVWFVIMIALVFILLGISDLKDA